MKFKVLHEQRDHRTFFLVFQPGDAFLKPMIEFAQRAHISGASFTGLGALSEATLAWFDTEAKIYRPFEIKEQVECASMVGNISVMNGKPFIHAHCVLGRRDGGAIAGHVKELRVLPTLEVTVTELPRGLERKVQEGNGFALINWTD